MNPIRALVVIASLAYASQGRAEVVIDLHSATAATTHAVVTVADIAKVTGDDPSLVEQIKRLDLEKLTDHDRVRVTRRQVELRVRLARLGNAVSFAGVREVLVSRGSAASLRSAIEEKLHQEICRQFGLPAERVNVHLQSAQQIEALIPKVAQKPFKLTMLGLTRLPIGRTTLQVQLQCGENTFVQSLDVQSVILHRVAVAAQPIPRGSRVEADMLQSVLRPASHSQVMLTQPEIVGRIARTRIGENATIRSSDLAEAPEVVVRPNKLIDVIYAIGNSEIRLRDAKTLSTARIGEKIMLRNTRSGRDFSATLVSRNLARISRN